MLGDGAWPPAFVEADARVCYTSPETDEHGTPGIVVSQQGDAFYRLRYWDGTEFLVDRPGTRVWARWPASTPAAEIEMCVFGPIIGFVLHLRGTPCLHASAVAVDGRAIAFLGHSGAGKSTTAAAFVRRGFRGVTDDVLALEERREPEQGSGIGDRGSGYGHVTGVTPSRFFVRPGHNVVRLCPDAVSALFGSEDALPFGGDATDKRHLDLSVQGNGFHAESLPLGAVYVLNERRADLDSPASITPLKGHGALMALIARTYMNYVLDAGLRGRAFDVFSRLAAQVPVRQVTVRGNAGELGALTETILADFRML